MRTKRAWGSVHIYSNDTLENKRMLRPQPNLHCLRSFFFFFFYLREQCVGTGRQGDGANNY